jgi:hypothetical protein
MSDNARPLLELLVALGGILVLSVVLTAPSWGPFVDAIGGCQ